MPAFDRSMVGGSSGPLDATGHILRVHLLAERALIELIAQRSLRPSTFRETRLRFLALVEVARAFIAVPSEQGWIWDALEQLNSVRNAVAHGIQADYFKLDAKTTARLKQLYELVDPHGMDLRFPNGRKFHEWDASSPNNAVYRIGYIIGDCLNSLDTRATA